MIVTKLGARRPADGSWKPAVSPQELTAGVHDNLANLGLDALDIVNYRAMGAIHGPAEGSIAEQVSVLADLKRKGLIRHIGLSNVTAAQVAEAQTITPVVCVQNNYNLAHTPTPIGFMFRRNMIPNKAAGWVVFQDGSAMIATNGDIRVPTVLDNLILWREIPVMIGSSSAPPSRRISPNHRLQNGATAAACARGNTTK